MKGTKVWVKREVTFPGQNVPEVIYEGAAEWRTEHLPGGVVETGWMRIGMAAKVPVPTHWDPAEKVE